VWLTHLVALALNVLIWLIIIEAILANVIAFGGRISTHHPLVRLLRSIVDPLLNPVRRLLPSYKTRGWDLSPLIVILLLNFVLRFLNLY